MPVKALAIHAEVAMNKQREKAKAFLFGLNRFRKALRLFLLAFDSSISIPCFNHGESES